MQKLSSKTKKARKTKDVVSAKPKKRYNINILLLIVLFFAIGLVFFTEFNTETDTENARHEDDANNDGLPLDANAPILGRPGSAHHHSTFVVFINGKFRRFDEARYYGASRYAHVHDYSFAEIHTHAVNLTLGYFFRTLNVTFNSSCIAFDSETYCTNSTHNLKFYVEGERNDDYENHLTADWEHYLISYGDDSQKDIQEQIDIVPDPLASESPRARRLAASLFRARYQSL